MHYKAPAIKKAARGGLLNKGEKILKIKLRAERHGFLVFGRDRVYGDRRTEIGLDVVQQKACVRRGQTLQADGIGFCLVREVAAQHAGTHCVGVGKIRCIKVTVAQPQFPRARAAAVRREIVVRAQAAERAVAVA